MVSCYRFDTSTRMQIDSVFGTVTDSIRWENFDFSNGTLYWPQSGVVRKNGNIFFEKDSMLLEKIPKKIFDSVVNNTFHPKLIDRDTTLIRGHFKLHVKILNCNQKDHSGISIVNITDRKSGRLVQTIESNQFVFWGNIDVSYADYNFDHHKDLAFCIGNRGSYGTIINDYFLYDAVQKQFVYSDDLNSIAGHLGVEWDHKNQRIIADSRGSCCSHYKDAYKVINGKFVKVKKMSVIMDNQENDVVEIQTLKNGKWHKTTRTYSEEQFKKARMYESF